MLFDSEYKKYLSILTERCHPPLETLQKYKDDDNAFLSFTQDVYPRTNRDSVVPKVGTKIGLNPLSEYDTPIGVYFYPIKAFWDKIERNRIPFAGSSPHLYIVKANNYEKLLIGSKYTEEDFERDLAELKSIYPKIDFDSIYNKIDYSYRTHPAQKFWSLTRGLSILFSENGKIKSKQPVIWTQILRRFYDGVVDDAGWGFIHTNEPTQAVIWTKAQFKVVDYVDRTCRGNVRDYGDLNDKGSNTIDKIFIYYIINGKPPKGIQESEFLEKINNLNDNSILRFIINNSHKLENILKDKQHNILVDIILKSQSPTLMYYYVESIMKYKDVTDEMINLISNNRNFFDNFLINTKFNYINDVAYKKILDDKYIAANYVEHLMDADEPLHNELVDSVVNSNVSTSLSRKIFTYLVDKGQMISDNLLKFFTEYAPYRVVDVLSNYKRYKDILRAARLYVDDVSDNVHNAFIDFFADLNLPMIWTYKFITEVLIPKEINIRDIFVENNKYSIFENPYSIYEDIRNKIYENKDWVRHIAKNIFKWKDLPPEFKDMLIINIPPNATFLKENNVFDVLYHQVLMESFSSKEIDMNRAYEIFNQEYLQSTGKSWSKDKFLQRAVNWEFWGDDNGFVTTRNQNSGFVKLVGAAGSDKSKYKGFKELTQKKLPVWGMVDAKIAGLLKKLGYRGPNMVEKMAFKVLLKSGKMNSVLGDAKIISMDGDKLTLQYPDVGTVEKYFIGSPEYWERMKSFKK